MSWGGQHTLLSCTSLLEHRTPVVLSPQADSATQNTQQPPQPLGPLCCQSGPQSKGTPSPVPGPPQCPTPRPLPLQFPLIDTTPCSPLPANPSPTHPSRPSQDLLSMESRKKPRYPETGEAPRDRRGPEALATAPFPAAPPEAWGSQTGSGVPPWRGTLQNLGRAGQQRTHRPRREKSKVRSISDAASGEANFELTVTSICWTNSHPTLAVRQAPCQAWEP